MRQLTAWTFSGADTAQRAEVALAALSAREPVTLDDGVQLWWPSRRRGPNFRGLENTALVAAVGTGFWGLLFGTLFVVPALSARSRSDPGAFDELFSSVGISRGFLSQLRGAVVPDSSALLVLAEAGAAERAQGSLAPWRPQRAETVLLEESHRALRALFGG